MLRLLSIVLLCCPLWGLAAPALADISVRGVRVPADTDNGTQDITIADWGYTPQAAIVWITNATANATPVAHLIWGIGVTDCTRALAVGIVAEDAVGSQEATRRTSPAGTVIETLDPPNATLNGAATINSCIANGIRIDWGTDPPPSAFLINAVFFAGSNLTAYADSFLSDATIGNAVDITAPGFEPDNVFLIGSSGATRDSATPANFHCFGVATNTGAPFQGGVGWHQDDSTTLANSEVLLSDSYACRSAAVTGGTTIGIEIGGWDASGFSATTREIGIARYFGYLALNYGGAVSSWAGVMDTPIVTGNNAQTGPGFAPQAVILIQSQAAATDVQEEDNEASSIALSIVTPTESYGCTISNDEGDGTADVQSRCDDQAALLPLHDFTTGHAATFVSMDATGWTLNFTTTQGTVARWVAWAIGANPSAAAVQRRRGLQW